MTSPLETVRCLFEDHRRDHDIAEPFSDWNVPAAFERRLRDTSVPLLDDTYRPGSLSPNTLVRVIGMVQDIRDPELYGRVYEGSHRVTSQRVTVQTQYTENPRFPPELDVDLERPVAFAERLPIVVVPIPGECDWSRDCKRTLRPLEGREASSEGRRKRARENASTPLPFLSPSRPGARTQDCDDGNRATPTKSRRTTISPDEKTTSTIATTPLPAGSAIVKVHVADRSRSTLKLDDIVEIVGVLCINPEHTQFPSKGGDDDDKMEIDDAPRDFVPCVHALVFRRLSSTFYGSVVPCKSVPPLQNYLTRCLGGDRLAAEFLMLSLVSRVHKRVGAMPVGSFPLCLTSPHSTVSVLASVKVRLAATCTLLDVSDNVTRAAR